MTLSLPAVGWWLAQCAVGGGLILLATLIFLKLTRQPALKQRLGEWGLISALIVAVFSLLPGWWVLPWEVSGVSTPPDVVKSQKRQQPAAEIPAAPFEVVLLPQAAHPPALVESDAPPVEVAPHHAEKTSPTPPAETTESPWISWQRIEAMAACLVVLYVAGLMLLLLRLVFAMVAVHRIVRGARAAPTKVRRLLQELAPVRRQPRLLVSKRLRIPVSFGLFRPTIVLPAKLLSLEKQDRLRWVLVHEMTHLQRRDAWSGLLCGLAQAVYFFLPWCWSICRQVRLCQEYVADASAVGKDQEADYAEFLLSLIRTPELPMVATGVSGRSSDLFRRVSMLVEKPFRVESRCSRRGLMAAAAALTLLAVVVSGACFADGGKRRTIIIITEEKKSDADSNKSSKLKQGVYRLRFAHANDEDEDEKRVEHKRKKIVILRKAGPGEKEVRQIVIGGKSIAIPHGQAGDAAKKIIAILQLGNTRVPISLEDLKKFKVTKADAKRVKIWRVKDGKAAPGKIEVKVELHGEVPDLKGVEEALKKLNKILGKKETDKLRKTIREALKNAAKHGGKVKVQPRIRIRSGKDFSEEDIKRLKENLQKQLKQLQLEKKHLHEDVLKALENLNKKELKQQIQLKVKAKELQKLFKHNKLHQYYTPKTGTGSVYGFYTPETLRLGVGVVAPSAILADQLGLAKGKGLVITSVTRGSPAEKAGFRRNDVLIEFADKAVSSSQAGLQKVVAQARGKKVNAVVYRKGKRRTIKGIELAKRKSTTYQYRPKLSLKAKNAEMMNLFRSDNNFNAHYQKGNLSVSVFGAIAKNKARVRSIIVREGGRSNNYTDIKDVPKKYRAHVANILDLVNRGPTKSINGAR